MPSPIIAIDIGNSRVKLGLFRESPDSTALPRCADRVAVPIADPDLFPRIERWLLKHPFAEETRIGSVNPLMREQLLKHWPAQRNRPVTSGQPPEQWIANLTQFPERVGQDRLANALAANRLRGRAQPAIIIDAGTATKVDLVDASGAFRGGAILAGLAITAAALAQRTAQLPDIETRQFAVPPTPVGDETIAAIQSGLYWGHVGAVRELVTRISESLEGKPLILLTGGAAPVLAPHLPDVVSVETLTLQGILLAPCE